MERKRNEILVLLSFLIQCFHKMLQIVSAVQRILYATDSNPAIVAEAQAMILQQMKQKENISPNSDVVAERPKLDTQKRKNISTLEVDAAAVSSLSPRQRLSDISDVHHNDSPLTLC